MSALAASVTSTGTLVAGAAIVHTVHYRSAGTAGTIVLRDGGAGGAVRLTINTPAAVGAHSIAIKGGGLHFGTDVHATLTTADAVTVIYQAG